jgi:magnesium chelatase family protein
MALASAYAMALLGLKGIPILVEADISSNLPAFNLVGLPDAALSEASSRVRSACSNTGFSLPARRITVNLSPASVPKHGSTFDLSIAVAVLCAAGQFSIQHTRSCVFIGELALDGSIRRVSGVLAMVLSAARAGFEIVYVPMANLTEASCVEGIKIVGVSHLAEVLSGFGVVTKELKSSEIVSAPVPSGYEAQNLCMSEVRGQAEAVDAALVAAAGGHHMIMVGIPGSGKTMIAQRMHTLLPELSQENAIELAAMRSLVNRQSFDRLDFSAPIEAPHHSASMVSVIGGGSGVPKPGLASLASHGVLFLDEAPEFSAVTIDALRQPLESGDITLSRATASVQYPAKFQLVLAANPCPCGKGQLKTDACQCAERIKARYLAKISGPILDRLDIQLSVRPVSAAVLAAESDGAETSLQLRSRVSEARRRAAARLTPFGLSLNSQVAGSVLRKELRINSGSTKSLDDALHRGRISMRGYDKCLRLAWTNADLAGRNEPNSIDVAKALWLRGVASQLTLSRG